MKFSQYQLISKEFSVYFQLTINIKCCILWSKKTRLFILVFFGKLLAKKQKRNEIEIEEEMLMKLLLPMGILNNNKKKR